ncbi:MAG: DUF362 domain-containing protein [Proteobacteria bacterium]|nr:DUF362 domain-containing protein [Pseudomonadota bacterium]
MPRKMSRRGFIKSSSKTVAALGATTGSLSLLGETLAAPASEKSKIIIARNENAINSRNVCNPKIVDQIFTKSLFALTGKSSSKAAWTSLGLKANDVVAVKINCNTWTIQLNPHKELVHSLCKSLKSVIPSNQIVFYERTTAEIEKGGFKANNSKNDVRFFGNDEGGGYDPDEKLTRIITDKSTKLINLASFKCVGGDFIASLFFKNHVGSLKKEDMPKCHDDLDFLAEICSRPSIKNKTILNLMDGLRGTYERGVPWYWSGIIMGTDPIAAEYTAIQVANEKRKQEKLSPFEVPTHLKIAEKKYKLGTCNPDRIETRKI